ncbi:hypothetical protein [Pontibacter arcticus]|uniref:TIGR02588 family protein n=1 Tax=Pontibacter arcticus TaxID=2080288 RepID=A0A364REJ3_9BACT|nr:hypothetical protein [Pontibacter arcticus]RAU82713.1 hypothetical protein DP923_05500 [Pontibacter arcticus]
MSEDKEKKLRTILEEEEAKNPLEWAVFALGLVLVLAILGYLGFKTYTYRPSPPDLQLAYAPEPTMNEPNRFRVVISNKGNTTAEEVKVQVVLQKAGQELEKVELQLPFVPRGARRTGWVIFTESPASADTVSANVISYRTP